MNAVPDHVPGDVILPDGTIISAKEWHRTKTREEANRVFDAPQTIPADEKPGREKIATVAKRSDQKDEA